MTDWSESPSEDAARFQPGDLIHVEGSHEGGRAMPHYQARVVSVKPSGTVVADDLDATDGAGTPIRHYISRGTIYTADAAPSFLARHRTARARVMGEELAETDADTEATNRANDELPAPAPDCTGYIDPLHPEDGIQHDGDTCPIHEDQHPGGPAIPEPEDAPCRSCGRSISSDAEGDFCDTCAPRPDAGHPAGWVELIDGGELSVHIGDLIVFDPTGRDLGYEYVVGVVIDFDLEAQQPGERPAPLCRINATDPGELCVVRRAKAVLA